MIHLRRYVVAMLLVALPCGAAVATFHPGDSGEDIRVVQTRLGVLGYSVEADGIYGQATAGAVRAFQEEHGLEADGLIGPITYRALIGRDIPVSRGDVSTALIRRIVSMAQQYIGVPYVYGGTTPSGFDCSGFVQFIAANSGLQLPRSADEQYQMGRRVASDDLRPGDFVFFSDDGHGISHSGIYLGYGRFISATSSRGVAIDSLSGDYWGETYIGARRMI